MSGPITWHRPEYRDRDDQLINLAQVAALASVTRAAVSNWRRRHDFPAPAMTVGHSVWVVRTEVQTWLSTQRRTQATPSQRSATLTQRITTLEAREQKQAAALAATRERLRAARQQHTTSN